MVSPYKSTPGRSRAFPSHYFYNQQFHSVWQVTAWWTHTSAHWEGHLLYFCTLHFHLVKQIKVLKAYIKAAYSVYNAVMALKVFLLAVIINAVLTDNQVELEATHSPILWTLITGSNVVPQIIQEPTENTEDQPRMITENNPTSLQARDARTDDVMAGTQSMNLQSAADIWTQDGLSNIRSETTTVNSFFAQRYPRGYNDCSLFAILGVAVLPCILTFIGLIGNALIMLVFWQDRRKSAMYVLLLQLAVVDSLVLVIWSFLVVTWVFTYFIDNPPTVLTTLDPYITKYGWPTGSLIQPIAIWLIVFISMQRYVAVCHPHKMRLISSVRVAWIQLAALVTFAVLFNVPFYMYVDIIILENSEVEMKDTWLVADPTYQFFESLTKYLTYFVVPFILLIFFTVSLIRQLRKSKMKLKLRNGRVLPISGTSPKDISVIPDPSNAASSVKSKHTPAQAQASKTENSITLSLIVADIVFLICQPIYPLRRFLEYILMPEQKVCGTPYSYYELMISTGIFVNSSVNFVVFCLCSEGFRRQVFQRLGGKFRRVHPASSVRHN